MPNVPPDPRTVINARIHHFKKQTQKLNVEMLEAAADLERAKQVVRDGRSIAKAAPAPSVGAGFESRPPLAKLASAAEAIPPMTIAPAEVAADATPPMVAVRPFAEGLGYALTAQGTNLWFDSEVHAINYAQEVFPHCEIVIFHRDGSVSQRYDAMGS